MKIIFAGTSHGIPEKNSFCSSTFIVIGEKCYIIDAGAPISPLILNYGIKHEDVRGIFVTHLHGDHFNGLPEFCEQVSWYYQTANPEVFVPDEKGVNLLQNWVKNIAPKNKQRDLNYHVYEAGCIYDDGTVRVTALPTKHNLENSHAFKVETEGKRLLFTGDMSHNFTEFAKLHNDEEYDLVVCESAHCFDFREVSNVVSTVKTRKFVINHINPAKLDGIKAFQETAPWECSIAFDGYTLEL